MADATIPGLADWGLATVPGYRVDPFTGQEDPTWRTDWFAWRDAVKAVRVAVQSRCEDDPVYRQKHLNACKNDPAFFVTMWLWVEEPRGESPIGVDAGTWDDWEAETEPEWVLNEEPPDESTLKEFVPYAYQVELIQLFKKVNSSEHKLDVYVSKARGIGISYTMLAAAYCGFLFRPWRGIFLSEKLEKADRSMDLSSMFGKVDLFFHYTPKWMRPRGWNAKSTKHRQQGMFKNPENGIGQLTATATTPSAGRGDRATYTCSDESAFQEHYQATHATLEGTTAHRWAWSSESYSKGYQWQGAWQAAREAMTRSKEANRRPHTLVREIDWYENPFQDQAWHDATLARFKAAGNENAFGVEYLRNPDMGYSTFIYPTVRTCPDVAGWWMPDRPLHCSVDPGTDDDTALVWWQTHFPDGRKRVRWLHSYVNRKMPAEFYAHLVTGIPPAAGDTMWTDYAEDLDQFGARERFIMDWMAKVPPGMLRMYGDPAMAADHAGGKKKPGTWEARFWKETARLRERTGDTASGGIYPMYKELYRRNRFQDRRTHMREALTCSEFSLTEGAQELKEAISKVRLQEETEKTVTAPGWIHDRFTHPTAAAEYGMSYEMMQLTLAEIAPAKPEKLPGFRGRVPVNRMRHPATTRGRQPALVA